VKVIDSTTISPCLGKYKWATFRKTKAGVKLHLRVTFAEPGLVYPDKAVITPAKPADHTKMDVLIDETDATYVGFAEQIKHVTPTRDLSHFCRINMQGNRRKTTKTLADGVNKFV
jgi:hypothetical protein